MRIELESPYKELYSKGYLRADKSGRKRLDLVNDKYDRTTVSYARYLLSVKEGRLLEEHEEVDHINNDSSDDRLENLQVLSKEEYKAKTLKHRPARKKVSLVCPQCNKEFDRWANQLYGRDFVTCSNSCKALHIRARGKWLGRKKQ